MLRNLPIGTQTFDILREQNMVYVALQQIIDKDYAAKYTTDGRQTVLVGINFSSRKRGIGAWKMINLEN
jgi:ureidoglycolate hydrolase